MFLFNHHEFVKVRGRCRPYVNLMKQIIYDSHIQMLTNVRHGVSILSEDLGGEELNNY